MENYDYLDGKYELLEKLYEGGMGTIYKVRHRLLDEIRVIKVMRPQHETNEGLRSRFLREARMAVKLRHPHIAQMYDFAFDEAGRGFIVMEYVEGISLQEMLERVGAPSLRLSLDLARQTLTGLGFLHRKGIVHRDISPDNIMVAWDEFGQPMIKLIDLGIAKVITSTTALTVSGTFLGKLLYASPEQFGTSPDKVDQRSDIYSFGVVLYELFTGNRPFPGTSPQELIAGHLVKPPLAFAIGDPDGRVPDDLRAIVLKAIAKKPEDRYASAEALDEVLAAVQARFPRDPDEFTRILQQYDSSESTARIAKPMPGSTQRQIAAQFGLVATPQPISVADAPDPQSTAPTLLPQPNVAAGTDTMPTGEANPGMAAPAETQPTLILPEDISMPPGQAAGAGAGNGAPAAHRHPPHRQRDPAAQGTACRRAARVPSAGGVRRATGVASRRRCQDHGNTGRARDGDCRRKCREASRPPGRPARRRACRYRGLPQRHAPPRSRPAQRRDRRGAREGDQGQELGRGPTARVRSRRAPPGQPPGAARAGDRGRCARSPG
ncbi:MAG: hypothetical protein B7Z68_07600 [Acidobacteria bacterium 21-70-11]|nr:MAG: hypothetical protein B7Z68_07600 [Acidobacteria bacterium 21-70-11]